MGDDAVDYTSSAAAQARSVAEAGVTQRQRAAVSGQAGSISFGSSAVDFTTTTADATQRHEVAFEGRRAVNVQKTSFQLGDDPAAFVSTRMAEEGVERRPQETRFRPAPVAKSTVSASGKPAKASGGAAKSSWTLGSADWAPQTAAASSFQWPEGGGPASLASA
jgi:hypothetical protein